MLPSLCTGLVLAVAKRIPNYEPGWPSVSLIPYKRKFYGASCRHSLKYWYSSPYGPSVSLTARRADISKKLAWLAGWPSVLLITGLVRGTAERKLGGASRRTLISGLGRQA